MSASFIGNLDFLLAFAGYLITPTLFLMLAFLKGGAFYRWAAVWGSLIYFYSVAGYISTDVHLWVVKIQGFDFVDAKFVFHTTLRLVFTLAAIFSFYAYLKHCTSFLETCDNFLNRIGARDRIAFETGDKNRFLGYLGLLGAFVFFYEAMVFYNDSLLNHLSYGHREFALASGRSVFILGWLVLVLSFELVHYRLYLLVPVLAVGLGWALFNWTDHPSLLDERYAPYARYKSSYVESSSWWDDKVVNLDKYSEAYMQYHHDDVDRYSGELARVNLYLLEEIKKFSKGASLAFSSDPDGDVSIGTTPIFGLTEDECAAIDRWWPFDSVYSELRNMEGGMNSSYSINYFIRLSAQRLGVNLMDYSSSWQKRLFSASAGGYDESETYRRWEQVERLASSIPLPQTQAAAKFTREVQLGLSNALPSREPSFCGRTIFTSDAAGDVIRDIGLNANNDLLAENLIKGATGRHKGLEESIDALVSNVVTRGDLTQAGNDNLKRLFRRYLIGVADSALAHADTHLGKYREFVLLSHRSEVIGLIKRHVKPEPSWRDVYYTILPSSACGGSVEGNENSIRGCSQNLNAL
ncbi:hypothetical protein N9L75_03825 [Porticoccaceae bacterium]|nr:hypothetical protein [Porticoccaceae bacterium]MDA8663428.1 hypothetical protein [Porticoccaceae bacterium]MDA8682066.1 hypothetical protein [Porticoccaceae bacterium]MDB2343084.1 hypothetical protein [Porticoccaceae bacterium]